MDTLFQDLEKVKFFFNELSSEDTELILNENGEFGSYLLRSIYDSHQNRTHLILSVKSYAIIHYIIIINDCGLQLGRQKFNSVSKFLTFLTQIPYIENEIGIKSFLYFPYEKELDINYLKKLKKQVFKQIEINSIHKQGYVLMQKRKLLKLKWRSVWMVVDAGSLYIYKDKFVDKPYCRNDLCRLTKVETNNLERSSGFDINFSHGVHYSFKTYNKSEVNEWQYLLRQNIKQYSNFITYL